MSWGTKGETTEANDLGSVTQDMGAHVEVEVFETPADVNVIYGEVCSVLDMMCT